MITCLLAPHARNAQINFEKDIGEAVFMPLLEQSALASIGNSFGKAGVLVEGQVIGEDSRGQ